jgi:hypothetical protein
MNFEREFVSTGMMEKKLHDEVVGKSLDYERASFHKKDFSLKIVDLGKSRSIQGVSLSQTKFHSSTNLFFFTSLETLSNSPVDCG